jgi:putative endonuclease
MLRVNSVRDLALLSDRAAKLGGGLLKNYYVYIMASASRTLYTGVTNNLERRALQHRRKLLGEFTARYNINRLVYYEVSREIFAAIAREKQIKSWGRKKKIALIESVNRDWKDLSAAWHKTQGSAVGV